MLHNPAQNLYVEPRENNILLQPEPEEITLAIPTNLSALFKDLILLYARTEIQYPQLKAVTLAQWILESGRGESNLAKNHYNFGGLKWRTEMTGFATRILYQANDGADYYCQFASLERFIRGYWRFIDRSPYTGWEERTDSGEEFIRFVGPVYSPSPGYVDRVLALVDEAQILFETVTEPVLAPIESPSLRGTVILDPGHGGTRKIGGSSPNNAISASGIKEKTMTLEMALLVRDALQQIAAQNGYDIRVILTRTADVNVGIAERANSAKRARADLFLSIHFNGFNKQTSGVETYIRARTNDNVNFEADEAFAWRVQGAVLGTLRTYAPATRDRGVKEDSASGGGVLGVLDDRALGNVPQDHPCRACLVEIEFIDVPRVDRLLNTGPDARQVRRILAGAIAAAMVEDLLADR